MRMLLTFLTAAILLTGCAPTEEAFPEPSFVPMSKPSVSAGGAGIPEPKAQAREAEVSTASPASSSSPYDFVPLEDLPSPYPPEQADTDGVIRNIHGTIQSNEDKIIKFLQDVEYGRSAMIRIESVTMEGDPIYSDIEYHPEKKAFLLRSDSTRDRFGTSDSIEASWYPYLHGNETNDGEIQLVLSQWSTMETGRPEETEAYLPFVLAPEKGEEYQNAFDKLYKRYKQDHLLQRSLSPTGESWAGVIDPDNIAIRLSGREEKLSTGGREALYVQWQDENTLNLWGSPSQYWVYDIGAGQFTGQIAVCGLPKAPEE